MQILLILTFDWCAISDKVHFFGCHNEWHHMVYSVKTKRCCSLRSASELLVFSPPSPSDAPHTWTLVRPFIVHAHLFLFLVISVHPASATLKPAHTLNTSTHPDISMSVQRLHFETTLLGIVTSCVPLIHWWLILKCKLKNLFHYESLLTRRAQVSPL